MTLRVAQVHCLVDNQNLAPDDLLRGLPSLTLVAEAAAEAGAEIHVIQSSRRAEVHQANGVTYRFVPEMCLGDRMTGLMPWRLSAEIRRLNPDVIHFHGLEHPLHLRAVCATNAPVLVQDHASRPRPRRAAVRHWSLARAAACAFTSATQAEPFARAGELPRHLEVLEIPESSSLFTPGDRDGARQESGVFGDPALLWIGHLDSNKDPLTILKAVRLALETLPDLHLWCAYASGELLSECEALLKQDQLLARQVHLLGRVSHAHVEVLCRACDIFVLGSHREGSGYALIEALACGLAPVVSDIPSFRALTSNGSVGILVPIGNVEGFAAGIVAQARAVNDGSRTRVLRNFERHLSPAALGRRLVDAYEHVAASGKLR